jgi:GGDEF domain-containing protein
MKSKSITVYTVIIAVVFAVTVIFFTTNVVLEYKNGPYRTGDAFDNLVTDTKNAVAEYPADSLLFRQLFEKAEGSPDDYDSILLEKNGNFIYCYPTEAPVSVPSLKSGNLYRLYSTTFSEGQDTYVISAVMYLLRPSTLFYYARFSLILILSGTLLSIILLVYLGFSDTVKSENNIPEDLPEDFETGSSGTLFQETDTDTIDSDITAPDDNCPAEEKIVSENIVQLEKSPTDKEPEKVTGPDIQQSVPDPQGLFSPVTGFGWESYLETRLDSELIRSASSERDLALFLFRIPGFSFTDIVSPKICNFLLEQFQFKDLLFEYQSEGFAVIRENTTIDEAMNIAEEIVTGINKLCIDNNTKLKCSAGLSTRSVRMLPGKRLIIEAEEALEHALNEKNSPIIAFRVNADKYRNFVEKNA